MSTVPSEATSTTDEPLANLLFDYPGADIILRSQDSHHLRVPKIFIIHNSPVLNELVRRILDSPGDANAESSLPVVQLPESGKIFRYLLTFTLPVFPAIPPTHEEMMELLSVAQKYQMETVLVHIRGSIARQNPLPTHLEPALHIYALAQKYGLRPEALQSARTILKHSMTIEDLEDKLDIMSGASLYELWKYHERVQTVLAEDLAEFRGSGAHRTIKGLRCTELTSSQIPRWLDQYIESIAITPKLFDTAELNIAMARHIKDGDPVASSRLGFLSSQSKRTCECASIPSQTIRDFWEALASVVHGSFKNVSVVDAQLQTYVNLLQAESALSLVQEREDLQTQINPITSPPETLDATDMNFIIRSSDLVNFRVRKSVLATASPFFKDLLSLPQPSDSEIVDGLPVVQMSEDSELLNSLVSILYPIHTVLPNSYEKVSSLPLSDNN
jgi:BTB/POZ domain